MILVVDASVALKWFFRVRDNEADCGQALAILSGVAAGNIRLLQPPHFIAEVAAVLARKKPNEALADLYDLLCVECTLAEEPEIYATAVDLSIRCRQHLFDTLYHAVALHTAEAALVTADRCYYEKALNFGRIALLADLKIGP